MFVRQSVNPVDSLTMGDRPQRSDSVQSEFAGQNRMWVCEVRDESLKGGSYVVVSPLGTVDQQALPVRADRNGFSAIEDSSQPQTAESTTTTEDGNQGDA